MTNEEAIEVLNKIVTCIEEDNKFCDFCEDCEKCECNVSESELEEFEAKISRDYDMFINMIDAMSLGVKNDL